MADYTYQEKRQYQRRECYTEAYLYKDKDGGKESDYKATMKNYSQGGVYFCTDQALELHQPIYIQVRDVDESAQGPEKYYEYAGYVKWSSDLGTSMPDGRYGYGIKYNVPVTY